MHTFDVNDNDKRFLGDSHEYKFNHSEQFTSLYEEIENNKKNMILEGMQKYMPIGSVVKVDNINSLCMIIGFKYDNNGNEYDYLACCYPYGVDPEHDIVYFNHDQIKSAYHIGYINASERNFKESLNGQNKSNNSLR